MPRPQTFPRFCDPEEFTQDIGKTNHGSTLYIRCLDCGGPAWFDISKRVGQCYACQKLHKLHKHYKDWSNDAILDQCDLTLPASRSHVRHEPETLQPVPLSAHALQYIRSRGITQKTLVLFPLVQEVTLWGRQWLCWQNVAGGYDLREIFGAEKRSRPPKTYSRCTIRPGTRYVVGEGMFSALSYAQLHDCNADSYIILNSTSTTKDLLRDLPTWEVEHVILALDTDAGGFNAMRELYRAFSSNFHVTVHHPPKVGMDWNDILMEEKHGRNH